MNCIIIKFCIKKIHVFKFKKGNSINKLEFALYII